MAVYEPGHNVPVSFAGSCGSMYTRPSLWFGFLDNHISEPACFQEVCCWSWLCDGPTLTTVGFL